MYMKMDVINVIDDLTTRLDAEYKKRDIETINGIVVHHSASEYDTIYSMSNYHVNTKKWPRIGYHFVIDKFGNVYQTNSLTTVSYHCKGRNTSTIGICCIGDYTHSEPSVNVLTSLYGLCETIVSICNIEEIGGHLNYRATLCPGLFLDNYSATVLSTLVNPNK